MSVGMTSIQYGPGLGLINVQTRQFSQEPVYDDTGTDLL
jgi:hypothetical protein